METGYASAGAVLKRRNAMSDQIISTTPNGQAPTRKPYALESRQPTANAKMNA